MAIAFVVALTLTGGNDGGGREGGFVGGDLHSLAATPGDPGRLFVGGHQAVAVSEDGGRTWRQVESLEDADAMGWAFTDDATWVSGHPGLSRAPAGTLDFELANRGLPDTDVHAFGGNQSLLVAASPRAGVFASNDGGRTWEVRSPQAGQAFFGTILVDQANLDHLVAADARQGAVESVDGGRTWRPLGGVASATWVSSPAGDLSTIVASGPDGAARTSDGGKTWQPLEVPAGAALVEASPNQPAVLYAGGLSGQTAQVWVSRDGGRRWSKP